MAAYLANASRVPRALLLPNINRYGEYYMFLDGKNALTSSQRISEPIDINSCWRFDVTRAMPLKQRNESCWCAMVKVQIPSFFFFGFSPNHDVQSGKFDFFALFFTCELEQKIFWWFIHSFMKNFYDFLLDMNRAFLGQIVKWLRSHIWFMRNERIDGRMTVVYLNSSTLFYRFSFHSVQTQRISVCLRRVQHHRRKPWPIRPAKTLSS